MKSRCRECLIIIENKHKSKYHLFKNRLLFKYHRSIQTRNNKLIWEIYFSKFNSSNFSIIFNCCSFTTLLFKQGSSSLWMRNQTDNQHPEESHKSPIDLLNRQSKQRMNDNHLLVSIVQASQAGVEDTEPETLQHLQ